MTTLVPSTGKALGDRHEFFWRCLDSGCSVFCRENSIIEGILRIKAQIVGGDRTIYEFASYVAVRSYIQKCSRIWREDCCRSGNGCNTVSCDATGKYGARNDGKRIWRPQLRLLAAHGIQQKCSRFRDHQIE